MSFGILTKMLRQKAVYWGAPTSDGRGGLQFAAPVEIPARWEDVVLITEGLQESLKKAQCLVYVGQDLDEEGYMWLGSLATLQAKGALDPREVPKAYKIIKVATTPTLKADKFLRQVYL